MTLLRCFAVVSGDFDALEQCRRNQDLTGFEVFKGKKLHGALCGFMVTRDTTDADCMHEVLERGFEGHPFRLWVEKARTRRMC
jgi:hypothetical protein